MKKTSVKDAKATNALLTNKETSSPTEQNIKNSESNSEEMPSGRTRRRRSAIS